MQSGVALFERARDVAGDGRWERRSAAAAASRIFASISADKRFCRSASLAQASSDTERPTPHTRALGFGQHRLAIWSRSSSMVLRRSSLLRLAFGRSQAVPRRAFWFQLGAASDQALLLGVGVAGSRRSDATVSPSKLRLPPLSKKRLQRLRAFLSA